MGDEIFPDKKARLSSMKKLIDSHSKEWETIKHDINPLELVFTFVKGDSVARINPVSRAFFKMIEILHLIGDDIPSKPIRSLHIAESPGGFIQAMNWYRRNYGITDDLAGWSLERDNVWKKLMDSSRSWPYKPFLGTGDLLDSDVRSRIYEGYKDEKAWLVSGDGGFDFSDDYAHQETVALKLILSQFVTGIRSLETGGVFILKIFDCFSLPTVQLLWVFWKTFSGFRVIKPQTSRACNSEKYIVARGFKGFGENLTHFVEVCESVLSNDEIHTLLENGPGSSWETMDSEFKEAFTKAIGSMIDNQTNWIDKGIKGYKFDRTEKIRLAREWCLKHKIPINPDHYLVHEGLRARSVRQERHLRFSQLRQTSSRSSQIFG